jgi:hypothetical protein
MAPEEIATMSWVVLGHRHGFLSDAASKRGRLKTAWRYRPIAIDWKGLAINALTGEYSG